MSLYLPRIQYNCLKYLLHVHLVPHQTVLQFLLQASNIIQKTQEKKESLLNVLIYFKIIYLFIFCLYCVFAAAPVFLQFRQAGATLWLQCVDFSWWLLAAEARLQGARASVVPSSCGSQALEHRFSSCGPRAQLP